MAEYIEAMFLIIAWGIYFKILNPIIRLIPILMINPHTFGDGTEPG